MSISVLSLLPSPTAVARPSAVAPSRRARLLTRLGPPREPGLTALGLGLLALTSSVHPLWTVPSIGIAAGAIAAAVVALLRAGERRQGAIGAAAALLALAIASVTVPATLEGAVAVLAWIGSLRP
ncbi:hypothetical protein NB037_08160 [Rathayibacter sp. ZW T2_19]|uniref:Uncharacterized protein n=1 Tax=Rathayibacter rubneri TaxID=2950106 RepID=A0A9X2DWE8_9MICO|nr:hypothetical protein [Rathayibacter rubneri]MCM6762390.1 hypothetical protein [Rathayibacter rubneri]